MSVKISRQALFAGFAMVVSPLLVMGLAGLADRPTVATPAMPAPAADTQLAPEHGVERAVLAGGCFWGMQEVFEHVKGVKHVTAGYSGGAAETAHYDEVSTGLTGHAESVQITFDPAQVSYEQLLKVYFKVAHNPTEINRQDPDRGAQYRSAIFFADPKQQKVAEAYITQITAAKVFSHAIVTQVTPLKTFYPAEGFHQDYAEKHPEQPYIAIYDLPKLAKLQKALPDLYVPTAAE